MDLIDASCKMPVVIASTDEDTKSANLPEDEAITLTRNIFNYQFLLRIIKEEVIRISHKFLTNFLMQTPQLWHLSIGSMSVTKIHKCHFNAHVYPWLYDEKKKSSLLILFYDV